MARGNVIRAATAIDVVEAAYRLDGSESAWLHEIVGRARPDLDVGCGAYAFTGNASVPEFAQSPAFVHHDLAPEFLERLPELNETVPRHLFERLQKRLVTVGGLAQSLGPDADVYVEFRRVLAGTKIVDGFSMFAQDAQGGSVTMAAPTLATVAPSPRVRGIWQRVGLHIVAGLRLRRKLAARVAKREALLTPSGKLEDARADVGDDASARRALVQAVRAMDEARRSSVRASPERALDLWRGLVAGRWSLVDHWEDGGRRYIAAYSNPPGARDPRALTETEQSVLRYLALGATNKEASYALGLPEKTVSWCVTQILKKLQVRSRVELAAMLDASRASWLELPLAGDRLGVLAVDAVSGGALADRLTVAERAVAEGVARGLSNAQIAATRKVAESTVAKQLQAIYDKLGVDNRSQLARVVSKGR